MATAEKIVLTRQSFSIPVPPLQGESYQPPSFVEGLGPLSGLVAPVEASLDYVPGVVEVAPVNPPEPARNRHGAQVVRGAPTAIPAAPR